ncbi:hypothetical protein QTP88_008018 [Uroleucon formosanum]
MNHKRTYKSGATKKAKKRKRELLAIQSSPYQKKLCFTTLDLLKSEINFDVPTVSITDLSFVDPSLEPENGNLNNVFGYDPAQICNVTNLTFEMTSKILELGPCQPEPIELPGGNYPQINGHSLTIKRKEHVYANREIVQQLIDITLSIGRHNLALRGHRENWHCSLRGNFKDLCSLLSKHSPTMANYMGQLEGMANNKKPQYSFILWRRQNDLIDSISYYIKHKVTNSIKKTRFFSIAIDSTFDVSHREQVSFIVRYFDDDSCNIQERLIRLRDIPKTTGYNLFQIFKEVCSSNGLNWTENLIGQSYDGASNMRGQYNGQYRGLQKYIRDENSQATYIWCCSHRLNLVVVVAVSEALNAVDLFGNIERLYDFISSSKFRSAMYEQKQRELHPRKQVRKLKRVSTTRWMSHKSALDVVLNTYIAIIETLGNIREESSDKKAASEINGFYCIYSPQDLYTVRSAFKKI